MMQWRQVEQEAEESGGRDVEGDSGAAEERDAVMLRKRREDLQVAQGWAYLPKKALDGVRAGVAARHGDTQYRSSSMAA